MPPSLLRLGLSCLCLGFLGSVLSAQPATFALSAERTSVVVETTTPIEVLARFSATVTGLRLSAGTFDAPVSVGNVLTVNETQTQLDQDYGYTPTQSQPQPSLALDTSWPAGGYVYHLNWTTFSGASAGNSFSQSVGLAWPATPVLQSPQPLLPIPSAAVDFVWQPWANAPASGGTIAFTLYEGLLTVEMIEQIAAGDYSSLSTFTVVNTAPSLTATTTTRSVAGINPELDHILVLEFGSRTTGTATPVATESRSSRMVTYFYRRELVTYAEWRAAQFSEADAANEAISGATADPDQDGVANLLEYALAMAPLVADSAGLPIARLVDGACVIDHFMALSASEVTLAYEELADDQTWHALAEGSYTLATIGVAQGRKTVRMTPSMGGVKKIVRLRATLTSAP